MRILLITPVPPDRTSPGAMPPVLHAQLKGLTARSHVTLATIAGLNPGDAAAIDRLVAGGVEVHTARPGAAFDATLWAQRGRPAARWLRGRWPWRTAWAWTPGLQSVVDGLLAEDRFDVVAVEDNVMGVYRIPGDTPRVLTEHEARRSAPPAHGRGRLRGAAMRVAGQENQRRWAPYLRAIWRSFDVVQTFSEPDADVVRRTVGVGGPPVVVNPFGIDLPDLRPTPQDADLVVFIGNYLHAPNLDAARWLGTEILPRVQARHPTVVLALAGGHAPAWLRSMEGEGLRVLGAVDDADELMRRAAVVVAPVRLGGGMRMKVLHAMALGTAVVTTTLGSEGLASDGRLPPVIVADDAEALADGVSALLADPARRRRLGDDARAFVERHHSPEAYAARLMETYRMAIERRRAQSRAA